MAKVTTASAAVIEIVSRSGALGPCSTALEASQAFRADSIDVPAGGVESGTTVAETLGSIDEDPTRLDDRELVAGLLNRLPERERRILELRFFAERSQRDIAEEIGISQMHVSRLLRRALATLRAEVDVE